MKAKQPAIQEQPPGLGVVLFHGKRGFYGLCNYESASNKRNCYKHAVPKS